MRVTINFDIEVSRAKAAMKSLIVSESEYVSDALIRLANTSADTAAESAVEVADTLREVCLQLDQYGRMINDLDNISHQQILPQPVDDVNLEVDATSVDRDANVAEALDKLKDQVAGIKEFTNFMEKAASENPEEG
jgi:hypothetical protein